ncbi:hypothetical protein [Williamsia phyllosphaerae]|uniref:Uncharacterized protein n=1 Tax=Williamsia phyllosphaerae TaxID=885042 RepID=A0ABQ1UJI1_9NOCA|nr:hypothetical protein [Williamsia phyllosphaerae]GGF18588.1 hypothetical protein GCM10007298_13230 [Williamsia phyllosphaerae]
MTRPRTLTVLVDELLIEDGAIPPPRVGSISSLPLRFSEQSPGDDRTTVIRALLEPHRTTPRADDADLSWSGLLRGDGWTAEWSGDRPRVGHVELTGRFVSLYEIGSSPPDVRGLVTRIRLVTVEYRATGHNPPHWEPTPGFPTSIGADLDAAPRFFERPADLESPYDEAASIDVPVGVLVDLDLDDVSPPAPRPDVVPGDVSCAGDTVWTVDTHLPVVVRLDAGGTATQHVLPGAIGSHARRVHATPTGCWVVGTDGVYRCEMETRPRLIAGDPVSVSAVVGETLLTCTHDSGWWLHTPGCVPLAIDDCPGSVSAATGFHDRFLLVVVTDKRRDEREMAYRMVRVSVAGDVEIGPVQALPDNHDRPRLGGDPVHVISGSDIAEVHDNLTVGAVTRLPHMRFGGGGAGRLLWTVSHPSGRTGCVGRWPIGPSDEAGDTRQYWMLELRDPATMEVVHTAPIFTSGPRVASDASGRIWVVADGLRLLSEKSMLEPEMIDLSGLLGKAHPSAASVTR